jgi:hypothetical protein
MIVLLAVVSAVEVLAFVGTLVAFLRRIISTLERIGGHPNSYLARITFGVRAIEKETSHLEPQVTQLNYNLVGLASKLNAVDDHLVSTAQALANK